MSTTPGRIGPYEILDEIASGGMGTVYRARGADGRDVALKVLLPALSSDADFIARFKREARAASELKHPNITQLYGAGEADGTHYLAMEYVPGPTLARKLTTLRAEGQRFNLDDTLLIIRQIALALDYAHGKGIVHRDIKPSNILLRDDGSAVLTDFGIVQLEGATKVTRTATMIGTPEYMSPEQANGLPLDGRSDIYSLGIVLWEMLAGVTPFTADTPMAVLYRQVHDALPDIAAVRQDTPESVKTVLANMLAKQREQRYATAGAAADDIGEVLTERAFLRDRTLLSESARAWAASGRDTSLLLRGRVIQVARKQKGLTDLERQFVQASHEHDAQLRQADQHRQAELAKARQEVKVQTRRQRRIAVVAIVLAGLLFMTLAATFFALDQRAQAETARGQAQSNAQEAQKQAADAEAARQEAVRNAGAAQTARATSEALRATAEALRGTAQERASIATARKLAAQSVLVNEQYDLGLLLGLAGYTITDTVDTRGALITNLESHTQLEAFHRAFSDTVPALAMSPDGAWVATGGADKKIVLWDRKTWQPARTISTTDTVWALAFSPDGSTLAAGENDKRMRLWNVSDGTEIVEYSTEGAIYTLGFSPDGQYLAGGGDGGKVFVRERSSGQQVAAFATGDSVLKVKFQPGAAPPRLAVGNFNGTVSLWRMADVRQPVKERDWKAHSSLIFDIDFDPSGRYLATAGADRKAIVWGLDANASFSKALEKHFNEVQGVTFGTGAMSGTIATGSADRTIILWNLATFEPIGRPLMGHTRAVNKLVFEPNGTEMVSVGADGAVISWDMPLRQLVGHRNEVEVVAMSPDGRRLATGSSDRNVIVWDAQARVPLGPPLTGHRNRIKSLAFRPNSAQLASASNDRSIIIWDLTDAARPRQVVTTTAHANFVNAVAYSPGGDLLVSGGGGEDNLIVWDASLRKQVSLRGHAADVWSVAFSPDGRYIASGAADGTVRLWDGRTFQALQTLTGYSGIVWSVTFSPDGKQLATTDGYNVYLWDVTTMPATKVATLGGHATATFSLAYTADGRTLAVSSSGGLVYLWDLKERERLGQPLANHSDWVRALSSNLADNQIASASFDRSSYIWDLRQDDFPGRVCAIVNRNLTQNEWLEYIGDAPYRKLCPNAP